MEIYLDKRAVKQIRLSAQEAIEEDDMESLREDILEAFTEDRSRKSNGASRMSSRRDSMSSSSMASCADKRICLTARLMR